MPKRKAGADVDDEEEPFQRGRTSGAGGTSGATDGGSAEPDAEVDAHLPTAASKKRAGKKQKKGAADEAWFTFLDVCPGEAVKFGSPLLEDEDGEALPQEIRSVRRLRQGDLEIGSVVLAAVRDVNEEELTLNLPFNLLGYALRAQVFEDASSEAGRQSLLELFPPGMLLVAVITSVMEKDGKKIRVEVSLRPSLANAGLTAEKLVPQMWLPATVSGDEEHVVKLDFGVEKLRGLVKKSELSKLASRPSPGSIIMVAVQAVNVAAGTVRCSLASSEPMSHALEPSLLKAGLLVSARVKKVFSGDENKVGAGLLTNFCGSLTGVVHLHHQGSAVARDGAAEVKKNQLVAARILAVVPGTPPVVHLTLLPHLLDWSAQGESLPLAASIGDRLDGEILDFLPKYGCRLRCQREGKKTGFLPGFCAPLRLADKDTEPPATSLAIGAKTTYRVLAYNFLDGLAMLTRRPADLEDGVLVSVSELSAGELVTGHITRTADHGIFVQLSDYVTGHVHLRQLTDVPLATVPNRFQVGSKVKCRVMHIDASRRQISLTAKKALVKGDFQLTDNSKAKTNMLLTGYVSSVKSYGAIVSFYGGAFGLIPSQDMSAEEAPAVGMAVRCRVSYVDKKKNRLILSLNLEKGQAPGVLEEAAEEIAKKGAVRGPSPGDVMSQVEVVRCRNEAVVVRCTASDGKQFFGYVPVAHLSDDLAVAKARCDALIAELGTADLSTDDISDSTATVSLPEEAVVLARRFTPGGKGANADGDTGTKPGFVLLSLKPSMRLAVQEGCFVSEFSELKTGRLYAGYVKEIRDFGALVSIGSWRLSGVAPKFQIASKFVEKISDELTPGESVRVLIAAVDEEKQRFDADLRPSPVSTADATLLTREAEALKMAFELKEALMKSGKKKKRLSMLTPGSLLEAEVTSVENYGLLLSIPARDGLTAVALKENMPDGFNAQKGSSIKCALLDFDTESGIADVSLQPELLGGSSSSAAASGGSKRKSKVAQAGSEVEEGQEIAVLPALQKKGYSVLWCQDPPAVVFSAPFGYRKWKEPRQTKVHSVGIDASARVVVLCPPGGRKKEKIQVPRIERPEEELQAGSPVKMRIRSIRGLQVFFTAPVSLRGHLHATQFIDLGPVGTGGESPLDGIRKTGVMETRMLRMQQRAAGPEDRTAGDKAWHLELTCRPSLMEPRDTSEYEAASVRWSTLKPGKVVAAAVLSVQKNRVWMEVAAGIRGRVSLLDASSDSSVLRSLTDHFAAGQVFHTRVLRSVTSQRELDLSLLPVKKSRIGDSPRIVLAKLVKIEENASGTAATFRLPEQRRAVAHITELFDVWAKQPAKRLKVGTIYEAALLRDWDEEAPQGLEGRAEVSLRPSLVHGKKAAAEEKRALSAQDLTVGQKVTGYVLNAGPKGVFVALSRCLVARVKLKSISDRPVMKETVAKLHPPGSLIRDARVTEVDRENNRVELSLRSGEGAGRISIEQLSVGDIVAGRVKAVEPYGLFVRLDNSTVDALIHKSEISDSASISLESYQVGTKIAKAKVVKIDGKRVSLTVKPSNFEQDELEEDDEEDSDDIQDLIEAASKEKPNDKRKREEEDENEEDAEEEPVKEEVKSKKKKQKKQEQAENVKPADSDDEEPWRRSGDLAGTSNGTAFDFAEFKVNNVSSSDEEADEDEADEKKRLSKRQKKAKKLAEEKELQQREADNADGQWADNPQSVEDFERLLLTQGDTSIVWIRYMAFHLKMSDLERARQVAERAVKHVGFAESKERFNAWVAYMNLECTFGTDESADAVFKRAASHNDAKQVYMQLARIHERNKKAELAAKAYEACSKKFPHSKKVWIAFLTFLYQQGDKEGSRKLLPKSLAALPRRKHPLVVSKAALLEYEYGAPERGRSIFEGLLDSYPKRTDLWSVYLDAHIKAHTPPKVAEADLQEVRSMMERCCTMKLKATKMRFFFKRWLDFEKKWGDAESQELVRTKAREFVESQAS